MTTLEKQLEQRITLLEKRMAMMLDKTGVTGEALDAIKFDEAIDVFARYGDKKPLFAYLREKAEKGNTDR